jgi:hypothetical protein
MCCPPFAKHPWFGPTSARFGPQPASVTIEETVEMTTLIRGLRSDRTQKMIDWGIFAAGAGSLAVALLLTTLGLFVPAPATAEIQAPAPVIAEG